MISIRSNFFYTRTVPCELWHFDRAKPAERKDKVLMLDARNVYRKVTRKIYDFSPEQLQNLASIVWLYRGQRGRFLHLVRGYLGRVRIESAAVSPVLASFDAAFAHLWGCFDALATTVASQDGIEADRKQVLADEMSELRGAAILYRDDAQRLCAGLVDFESAFADALPETNEAQHAARKSFDLLAEECRGLGKQVDLLYKTATRVADIAAALAADDVVSAAYDRRTVGRQVKQLDEQRKSAVAQLRQVAYFYRQVVWLQDRFPNAELQDVQGLVKLVDRQTIEAADWSLTPGRYVGVAPSEEDEDFDFERTLRDIHTELTDLNKEAVELARRIQENFEELAA
jgi:type I restriction enzyme M protein